MFPLECKELLPIDRLVVTSVSVRGHLGPMTVWVSNDPDEEVIKTKKTNSPSSKHSMRTRGQTNTNGPDISSRTHKKPMITANKKKWTQIYSKTLGPSPYTYRDLDLSENPIILKPGQVRGIYIHSTLPGDEAIVYDNYHSNIESEIPEDSFICLRPAMAHVSCKPFGKRPIWGWGDAWRRDRKFVGKINYGVVYKLWNPKQHLTFGNKFQELAMNLFACQRRFESPLSRLPDDCIFYVLNMCKWDWVGDDPKGMLEIQKKRKAKLDLLRAQLQDEKKQKQQAQRDMEDTKPQCLAREHEAKNQEHDEEEEGGDTKPSSIPNHEMEEWDEEDDVDYVNEDDHLDEFDAEDDEEDDEDDWDNDSDDEEEDEYYDDIGPILYQDEDEDANDDEDESGINRGYRRRFFSHHPSNRQFILGDFITAIMRVNGINDDDDNDDDDDDDYDDDNDDDDGGGGETRGRRVFMMIQSDDENSL